MESGNDYVLQVKGNQKNLHNAIKYKVDLAMPIDVDYTLEKNRSREEHREVFLYEVKDENVIMKSWPGIKHIIHVKTHGTRNKRPYSENRYYITSRKESSAAYYNKKIRDHWKIKNCLHWVKDKIMNEDTGMIKGMRLGENVSIIRNMIINIFRLNGEKSIKYAMDKFNNKLDKCYELID